MFYCWTNSGSLRQKGKTLLRFQQKMQNALGHNRHWLHTCPGSERMEAVFPRKKFWKVPVVEQKRSRRVSCRHKRPRRGTREEAETRDLGGRALAPGLLLIGQVRYLTVGWASSHRWAWLRWPETSRCCRECMPGLVERSDPQNKFAPASPPVLQGRTRPSDIWLRSPNYLSVHHRSQEH